MLPSPAELTYFSEVAQSLSLSRASQRLGVSQPSLSLAMKRLENSFGVDLLVRHKQGVTLTPAGMKLLAQVKPLLQHWANTKIDAIDAHYAVQGKVSIGCRSSLTLYLGHFLQDLMLRYPKLEIVFKFQSSLETTNDVIQSGLDIGVVINPLRHPDLVIYPAGKVELGFWRGQGQNPLQDIHSGSAVIICDLNVPQVQQMLRTLEKNNLRYDRILNANSLEVVAHLTAAGCGIGILPLCYAQISHADQLTKVVEWPTADDEFCLIYRHENKHVAAIQTVISELKALAAK